MRDITVRPVLLDADRIACRSLPDEGAQRRAGATVAAVLAAAAVVASVGLRPIGVLAGALAAGVAAVTAVGSVVLWRRWAAHRIERAGRTVAARAFEVVVDADSDEAEHELATWWDPEAKPARVSR